MARAQQLLHFQPSDPLARALAWFSLGLGMIQLGAPGWLVRTVGVDDREGTRLVVRAVGGRELATGLGIAGRARPRGWLWARVAGDALDIGVLAAALTDPRNDRRRLAAATAAVAGAMALDAVAARRLRPASGTPQSHPPDEDHHKPARSAITINRPLDEVYGYWRDFENLPSFMAHVRSVEEKPGRRSHWVVNAPLGRQVEWDAEIIEDTANQRIAWHSIDGSDVESSGVVTFAWAPRGQGTEVSVELEYAPPGGALGSAVAKVLGEAPTQQLKDDLRRFKQVLETGEVLRSDGSPDGTRALRQLRQRPARPHDDDGART